GLEADRLAVVRDGVVVLALVLIGDAAEIKSTRKKFIIGLRADRLAEIRNGAVEVALTFIDIAAAEVGDPKIGFEVDRLAVGCDGGVELALTFIGGAAVGVGVSKILICQLPGLYRGGAAANGDVRIVTCASLPSLLQRLSIYRRCR